MIEEEWINRVCFFLRLATGGNITKPFQIGLLYFTTNQTGPRYLFTAAHQSEL